MRCDACRHAFQWRLPSSYLQLFLVVLVSRRTSDKGATKSVEAHKRGGWSLTGDAVWRWPDKYRR
jgi:hypothetical protein